MFQVLVAAIIATAGVFLALTLFIVSGKAVREIRDARRRSRRNALEPSILRYVHGEDPSILAALRGGLARSDRPVVETILLDHVQRVRGVERERLARGLDELGYVDAYMDALGSTRWWTRAHAAENLGLAGAKRATSKLVSALGDDVAEVRLRAAKSLGLVGGRAAVRPLLQALGEPNRWSTIRIADILSDMGREVVHELMEAYPELNRHGRLAALDIVGRVHALETIGWLLARLDDDDADIRARAAHALGAIGVLEGAPRLRSALADPAWPVRAMAAKALGRIHDAEAIPELCATLRDREWWVRANAAEALKQAGPMGIEALEGMLADEDLYARHQACVVLEAAGILERRVAQLGSTGTVRDSAERVIQRFVAAGQTGRLRELAVTHGDPGVRNALARLLPLDNAPMERDREEVQR
ncbi:MAG TPA: HEAT repeat domain-containing protein [Candidatus Polarisedimenticolaceae bacterium]|nr:HEAT repeat domain-containing protein [Candidatus Polarisedimenticolaceae bacterium]